MGELILKKRPKESFIPMERHETIRQKIVSVLEGQNLSAKEISGKVGISEKEVYEHLGHIQLSIQKSGYNLILIPAECSKCGFVFKKRERFKKPGRCPVCRSESIQEPLFSIKNKIY
jgi:predicted Zn-ribbon and HTH transcriptional regulator